MLLSLQQQICICNKRSNSMEQTPSSEAYSRSASQEIFSPFMEPEGSLLCSQDPGNTVYPQPDESKPLPHTLFTEDSF
jgi:hypothetical protein